MKNFIIKNYNGYKKEKLLWVELCTLKIRMLTSQSPVTQKLTLFGERVIAGAND